MRPMDGESRVSLRTEAYLAKPPAIKPARIHEVHAPASAERFAESRLGLSNNFTERSFCENKQYKNHCVTGMARSVLESHAQGRCVGIGLAFNLKGH